MKNEEKDLSRYFVMYWIKFVNFLPYRKSNAIQNFCNFVMDFLIPSYNFYAKPMLMYMLPAKAEIRHFPEMPSGLGKTRNA